MTDFPALTPTSRSVRQGKYAVKRFTSIAGTGTTRAYGSQPYESTMEMEFSNIPDSSAILIVDCYESSRGSFGHLSLPQAVWKGMDEILRDRLQRDYVWRFSEQPSITSAYPGRSSVSVRLEGMRDG